MLPPTQALAMMEASAVDHLSSLKVSNYLVAIESLDCLDKDVTDITILVLILIRIVLSC